jgi:hypothetical protein
MRARTAAVTAAVTVVAASAVFAGGARAEVAVFDDSGDVDSSVDLLRVRVDNGAADPDQVRVRIVQDDLQIGDEVTVFLDTKRRDAGPEWKVTGLPAAEWVLIRTEGWASTAPEVSCASGSMAMHLDTDVTRVVLPRSCLDDLEPGKVRAAVRVFRDDPPARDWARKRRTFLPWVSPGD